MSKIFEDNSLTIGHTPLVRLNRIGNGRILAKVESRNPSFSVKCRIGANMIWDAEKRGVLKPGESAAYPERNEAFRHFPRWPDRGNGGDPQPPLVHCHPGPPGA